MMFHETNEKTMTAENIERWRYPRFFTENVGETALITNDDAKHITAVLRMKKGEKAVLCDNNGFDYLSELLEASRDFAEFKILEKRENAAEPNVEIRLFQCIPKADKMDYIVQKATELGVSAVIPVLSKRCVSRPDEKSSGKKIQRYQKIAEEAAKQCGRGKIPTVYPLAAFSDAVKEFSPERLGILFYECGGISLSKALSPATRHIDIFIGSEGGFAQEEAEMADKCGIKLATLGNRILRCETAPVAAIAILMNLTGNM